ncbi:ATP-binding cassette domain-containing protein [Niallia sp. NCCP-28]|uniref:ATP-binding cassette domain-containing protein n=1 Tax=Niallia sp. NCCP-28 TaxID=2934712 RepID=UPI00208D3F29|nr:ATP-binding cassette domain-containing protein [Niallia sp. NCCP-28]GKU84580.1 ABC transporter [Niallia sp. NCCP-28]
MLAIKIKKNLPHFTIDVELKANNKIVILFGPSGSGKTTILNCIAGLDTPHEGYIQLNQKTFYQTNRKSVKIQQRKVGYLFQDFALFPHMTVEKNIQYGMKSQELMNRLVQSVGIEHLLKKYPKQISGGEKQRVALARALATEPDILLLDEPFSSLDQETKEECYAELLRLHELWDIPIIMVTHDYGEAKRLGNHIIHLKKGKIVNREKLYAG